jgi:cob(I)alamin adenosyltransferase
VGHRLTKISTRTGDDGTTGLGDGRRVAKTAARIGALGAVDELNCVIGILWCEPAALAHRAQLDDIQQRLFDLGGELAVPGLELLGEAHIASLDAAIDAGNADLPPLREFLVPGGNRAAALCHLARAVCRRAEREVWLLAAEEPGGARAAIYLNRLSDLLFVIARRLGRAGGAAESVWQRNR